MDVRELQPCSQTRARHSPLLRCLRHFCATVSFNPPSREAERGEVITPNLQVGTQHSPGEVK